MKPRIIVLTIVLVAAAFVIRLTQPSDEEQLQPFVATVGVGTHVQGRDLTLAVDDVYLADRVTTAEWTGETQGVWLVVDATIGARLGIATPYAWLTAGDTTWSSSDRPGDAALGGSLDAGLPQSGSFVFEVPADLVDSPAAQHAVVRFATSLSPQLDSAFDFPVDLSSLKHESSATLQDPGVVTG